MKVRNGFVSNSSSSSFLVAFPRKPKNVKDVKEILFAKGQHDYPNPFGWEYADDDEIFWPVDQVAQIIWIDIEQNGEATKDEMIECVNGGYFDTYEDLPGYVDVYRDDRRDEKFRQMEEDAKPFNWSTEEGRRKHQVVWSVINKENVRRAKAILKRFKEKNPDTVFYTFEYCDNDGALFGAMEHGTLFRRVFHIKTSRH